MLEKTLIVVKPHAVKRGLVGRFLQKFEDMGLKIVEIKTIKGTKEMWINFYPSDEKWLKNVGEKTLENYRVTGLDIKEELNTSDPVLIGKIIKKWLIEHMNSSNSVAVILKGNEAIKKVRSACGNTLPNLANPGTIRFDFSSDSPSLANNEKRPIFNLVHASDPDETRDGQRAVDYEINILFPKKGG